eukprot:4801296-Pyramimonas_sp.AAC.2
MVGPGAGSRTAAERRRQQLRTTQRTTLTENTEQRVERRRILEELRKSSSNPGDLCLGEVDRRNALDEIARQGGLCAKS